MWPAPIRELATPWHRAPPNCSDLFRSISAKSPARSGNYEIALRFASEKQAERWRHTEERRQLRVRVGWSALLGVDSSYIPIERFFECRCRRRIYVIPILCVDILAPRIELLRIHRYVFAWRPSPLSNNYRS